jgi:hypothetical protein
MARRGTRRASRKAGRKTRKMGGKAKAWTQFVSKIYREMKARNPAAKLKDAMKEASRRKASM